MILPLRFTVLAAALVFAGNASAQTYTKTEAITYHDNTAKWVLGQTATVTCVSGTPASTACDNNASNGSDVVSATTYDPVTALPLTASGFGKLQSTTTYNTNGTVATVKDGNNKTTTLANWKRGVPQQITFADGTYLSASVDDDGWLSWVEDENRYRTCYAFDLMGRLSQITYPAEATGACDTSETNWKKTQRAFVPVASAEYGIPAGHWRLTETTGNAAKITYYDGMWRPLLVREYDASNISGTQRFTKTAYDVEGRVSFTSYPASSATAAAQQATDKGVTTFYDPLGRVSSTSQDSELGLLTTLMTYNTGFTTTVTNPRLQSTTTSYLAYDQPSTDWPLVITSPESAITTIARDTYGKPTSLTRSGGGVTPVVRSYSYYTSQELCRSVEPETGATLYGYDNAGNMTWSAAGMGSSTACLSAYNSTPTAAINLRKASRSYDNRNRLLTLAFPDSNGNQTWTYTPDGLPSTVSTNNVFGGVNNAVTNAYTYNKRRLLSGESMKPDTVQLGWGIGYGYNQLGQVVTEARPASVMVTYTVNALGQVTQVKANTDTEPTPVTVASAASYYPNGALQQFTYGNGIVHTMSQNARQLPSRSTDAGVLDLATTFDANGNVNAITDYIGTGRQTRSMTYDGLDRLTEATSPMFGTASYTYDTLDNLKQVHVSGRTAPNNHHYYCYNAANQLDFVRSGPACNSSTSTMVYLEYDAQGNVLNRNGAFYTFDYGNRLRTAAGLTYRYDAEGRRVRQQDAVGGNVKYSYYAKDGRLVWQRDEPGSKRISNIYLAGSLIAEYSRPIGVAASTLAYYHTDALGSPIAKTNSVGTVIETSEYELYGDLLNRPNDDRAGYTGHVMDSASGLTYMQQRYYDPQLGVFLSVDPVSAYSQPVGMFNRYRYANNNPYGFTDPDGREPSDDKPEVTGSRIPGSAVAQASLTNGMMRASTTGEVVSRQLKGRIDSQAALGEGGRDAVHFLADDTIDAIGNALDGNFGAAGINLAMALVGRKFSALKHMAPEQMAIDMRKIMIRISGGRGTNAAREFHNLEHIADRSAQELAQDFMDVARSHKIPTQSIPDWIIKLANE